MGSKNAVFAIVLSGCGVKDGSEIQEAVLAMLAVSRRGGTYQCFAPNAPQPRVINHVTGEPMKDVRNIMVEAARIARGKIRPLSEFDPAKFDGLIFPGGYGAVLNLSSFGSEGLKCRVLPEVEKAIKGMVQAGKPIGALCIAPVVLGKVIGSGIKLTVGNDKEVNGALAAMGAVTQDTTHGEVVVDTKYKVVSSPCYMFDATIAQVADGADNVVQKMWEILRA